jgi:hypothetical protein
VSRFRVFGTRQPAMRFAVQLDARAARLAALLTEKLQTEVVVQPENGEMVFFLLRPGGNVLSTVDDPVARGRRRPVRVALVPADLSEPITVWSKSVVDTAIRWIGSGHTWSVEEAVAELVRHYRPAIDPSVPVDTWSSTQP